MSIHTTEAGIAVDIRGKTMIDKKLINDVIIDGYNCIGGNNPPLLINILICAFVRKIAKAFKKPANTGSVTYAAN